MHSVHNGISTWIQKRRSLCNECEQVKEFFPKFGHREHSMRAISMKEKGLAEKGCIPVADKESVDYQNIVELISTNIRRNR